MNNIFRNRHFSGLLIGAAVLLTVQATGTVGYWLIGQPKSTWIDAFYMTFITIATIGYGEIVDLSAHPMGRLFTVAIAVVGIGAMSYLVSTTIALLVDADLNAGMRRKRMEKEIAQLRGHYIVCGVGRVGGNVAGELAQTQRPYVVVESDRTALDNWLEHHPETLYLHDDAADDEALLRAGVMHAAGVFAVTGDDSHNLMVSMSVKLLKPDVRVVVRLHDIRNEKKAKRAGADAIVSPDFSGGMRIASMMLRPHAVTFMDQMLLTDQRLRVEEVLVPAGFATQTLGQVLPRSESYLLMATHENGRWVFNPSDDHVLRAGAALVLMTSPEGRSRVERLLS